MEQNWIDELGNFGKNFKELGLPFDTPEFKRIVRVVPVKDVNQVSS